MKPNYFPTEDEPMKNCPDCEGVGLVPDEDTEEGFSSCTCCNGTGRVPKDQDEIDNDQLDYAISRRDY